MKRFWAPDGLKTNPNKVEEGRWVACVNRLKALGPEKTETETLENQAI